MIAAGPGTMQPTLSLLSRLWLCEATGDALESAAELPGFAAHCADRAALARAWTDLFLLGVYPYGSVFCEPDAELNGASAQRTARLFDAHGYEPPELASVGAPDHAGLCMAFLDRLRQSGSRAPGFQAWVAEWLVACCVAVAREPWAHPFYVALAQETEQAVLALPVSGPDPRESGRLPAHPPRDDEPSGGEEPGPEEEIGVSEIVRYFLAPARCGLFLSRAKWGQIGRAAGLAVPFGSRFDVARGVLAAAGERGCVGRVLSSLEDELAGWRAAYEAAAAASAGWAEALRRWTARLDASDRRLRSMRALLELAPGVDGGDAGRNHGTEWEKIGGP